MTINQLNSADTFTEIKYSHNRALNEVINLFPVVAKEFEDIFNRKYSLCRDVNCEDADVVIVTLGSSSGTVRKVSREMNSDGKKIGSLQISSFRPFPKEEVIGKLKSAKSVAVIDRSWSLGTDGPLSQEIKSALYSAGMNIPVYDFVAGLGGRDLNEKTIKNVVDKTIELNSKNEKVLYPIWIDTKKEVK